MIVKNRVNKFSYKFLSCKALLLSMLSLLFPSCSQEGFQIKKVTPTYPFDAEWDLPSLSSEEKTHINQLLGQTFYYLGRGDHCYAFLGEDRQTVLKFFKQTHLGRHTWHNTLPLPDSMMRWYLDHHEKRERRRYDDYQGYKNAFCELRDETGVMYAHLNPTPDFRRDVKLNYKGKEMHIRIDSVGFVLQRYCDVGFHQIDECMKRGDVTAAMQLFRSFLDLVVQRCEKGYCDFDMQFYKNFGFHEGHCYEFDIGCLHKNLEMKKPERIKEEVIFVSQQIQNWFHEHYKEYGSELIKVMQEVTSQLELKEEIPFDDTSQKHSSGQFWRAAPSR